MSKEGSVPNHTGLCQSRTHSQAEREVDNDYAPIHKVLLEEVSDSIWWKPVLLQMEKTTPKERSHSECPRSQETNTNKQGSLSKSAFLESGRKMVGNK